jgi:hypothetical protein
LLLLFSLSGCKKDAQTPVQPAPENNVFVLNPTFEVNGVPSLEGWAVPDTFTAYFSNDIPSGGSGSTIRLNLVIGPYFGWPSNCVYTAFTVPSGTHVYKLSFYGKYKDGSGGSGVSVNLNRPGTNNSALLMDMWLDDTSWTFCSSIDTLQTVQSDTLFLTIFGGSCECTGQAFFNTCKFEKLD